MNTITSYGELSKRNKKLRNIPPKLQNRTSTNISFTGAPDAAVKGVKTLITEADKPVMDMFSKYYGDIGTKVGEKLGKLASETIADGSKQGVSIFEKAGNKILQMSSRFSMEKGALSIKDKGIPRSVAENVIFPFVNLPLYGLNWVVKKAEAVPALKKGAEKLYKTPLLRVPRKLNELDWKTDSLKGIMEKTKSTVTDFAKENGYSYEGIMETISRNKPEDAAVIKKADEYIKENLYKVSNKFFDKYTGNFNTAYERPLNRIVTGLIPVAFLANDAYNLSVLCGDKKEDSQKEAKERRDQEISRVFTTAFIQLITFGAFTKQVNTKPWFTPLTSALTVLFSEVNSRRRNGKPVFFLTPEKAKERNAKKDLNENKKKLFKLPSMGRKEKTADNASNSVLNAEPKGNNTPSEIWVSAMKTTNTPQIFTSFKSAKTNSKPAKEGKIEDKKKDNEPKKALINFKTLKNGVIALTLAGFALSFLKNSSFTKNSGIMKAANSIGDFFKKKVYEPLAYKDFAISNKEFEQITRSLDDIGCKEIADGHKFIHSKYGKDVGNGVVKMYKSSLSNSKIPNVVKNTLDSLLGAGMQLSDNEAQTLTEAIKTAIKLKPTDIAENKFENVVKQAQTILENRNVILDKEQTKMLSDSIVQAMKSNVTEKPIQVETKLKPFVDIVTEPFKFVMSAAKLPFKIVSSLLNLAVSPIEKKAARSELGETVLTKNEKRIHRAVTEVLGEKTPKGGKMSQTVFANAMDALQKKTAPYINANKTLENLKLSGASAEQIEKAEAAVEKSKTKLSKYVYDAVEKSFNGITQSSNKNTDLAMMSKLASSAVTSAFLVADNYNMVMLKSNGEDKEGAKEKANERIIQRLSALFYQTLFINWFNSTFRSTYNSSLKGMAAVAIPNTLTTEILTRKSIGMPIGRKSLEELNEIDEKNEKRTGFAGQYFKFMRLLTGKKPLKDRLPKEKQAEITNANEKSATTNLLEMLSK